MAISLVYAVLANVRFDEIANAMAKLASKEITRHSHDSLVGVVTGGCFW